MRDCDAGRIGNPSYEILNVDSRAATDRDCRQVHESGVRLMKVSIIGGGGLVGLVRGLCAPVRRRGQPDRPDRPERRPGAGPGPRPAPRRLAGRRPAHPARRATRRFPRATSSIITAGLRRKPDESRLDLINRNVELFLGHTRPDHGGRTEARGDRAGRLQPGRRLDLSGGAPARNSRRTRSSAWVHSSTRRGFAA